MRGLFVICGILVVFSLQACAPSGSDESVAESSNAGSYANDGMTKSAEMTITTDEGVATIRSGSANSVNLPLGFSLYPGSAINTNAAVDHNGGKGAMVVFTTYDEPSQVVEYYRQQAEAAGITITLDMSIADGQMMGGEGRDGRSFTVNASRTDEGTSAQLMVSDKLGV